MAISVTLGPVTGCKPPGIKVERNRAGEEHLLLLKNSQAIVGVLPQVGGRTVVYRRPWGKNMLLAIPEKWNTQTAQPPELSPTTGWHPYYGHTVWLGPQHEWWNHQMLNPKKKGHKWPPEAWLVYGAYEILEKSDIHVVMRSPESPIYGMQLTKTIRLLPDGRVDHHVSAKNISSKTQSWGIWSNTRVPIRHQIYLPIDSETKVRAEFENQNALERTMYPYRVTNGFFTLPKNLPLPNGQISRSAKYYLTPPKQWVASIYGLDLFVKWAKTPKPFPIAPKQSSVEIYVGRYLRPKLNQIESMIELEFHGPYETLEPGESTEYEEAWQLVDYQQQNIQGAETEFLKDWIPRNTN
ncbi:MAG: DUF4380 domain-containing protein [Verrucomicrobiota bacterium]